MVKTHKLYWALTAILGTVHLQALVINLPWKTPVYYTILLALGIAYFLYRKSALNLSALEVKWHIYLFLMQMILITLYIADLPFLIELVPFLIFIGLEAVRQACSKKLHTLSHELQQFEEQRNHMNETFRIVRSERHDFLKHVSAVHFLLDNGKNKEAKSYLDELVGGYEETNLSIKGERGIVAGSLHQMYKRAHAAGISIVYDLDLPLSSLPFSDHNIVTLIGNLLSNSIDASKEWQKAHKEQAQISLQFYKKSGLYILICKNTAMPIPNDILDQLYEIYGITTKSDGHFGLGTKIIHDIVKEHQGYLDFVYKEEEFTVKIKIPAIR
ncbi:GHKL domain-containing protein [Metabacillus dongyingensis]|uniref:sensor histidine kinase n=1 Tax=Metabacillus dongyingensis TaxID=2874282 RepID=UPI003B8AD33A